MAYIPTFATEITDIVRNKSVNVELLNAFPDPVNNVITLITNTEYVITNSINFGINQIKIPDSGQITIRSVNSTANTITSELTGGLPFIFGSIARLDITNTVIISSTGDAECFDITAGTGLVPAVTLATMRVQGFSAIGTLDGASVFAENIGWLLNSGPLTLNNCAIAQVAEQSWGFHTGDHLVITGSLTAGFFNTLIGTPEAGASVFNISPTLTTNGMHIVNSFFIPFLGGDWFDPAGLDQTSALVRTFNNFNVPDSNFLPSTAYSDKIMRASDGTTMFGSDRNIMTDGADLEIFLNPYAGVI